MRRICVVTVGRSDLGIYLPILRAIRNDPELQLHIIATGAHLSPTFGWTVNDLAAAGFEADDYVDMLLSADTDAGIAKSMGLGVIGLAQVYQRVRPDLLLVLGDRFEMHAAALAAVPFRIPIAHIHGGEVTHGAIDDALRHSISKLSHLHFASTEMHAARIIQLGEEPWRVTVSGAPALDNLKHLQWLSRGELERMLGRQLGQDPLLVTYHPVTLQGEKTEAQIDELLAALDHCEQPIVITQPNADANHQIIIRKVNEFAALRPRVCVVNNLGTTAYFSLMRCAAAMVGNSSSGIIEAASFELPVVNIGQRQSGRQRSKNVLDVSDDRHEISFAIRRALSHEFRRSIQGASNVYGSGDAARLIVTCLKAVPLDERLIMKRFHDLTVVASFQRSEAA